MAVMLVCAIITSTQLKNLGNILKSFKSEIAKGGVAEDIVKTEDTELIINRLQSFSSAYNEGDLSGVLDCMDALGDQTAGGIELVGTVGEVFDVYIPDFFELFGLSMDLLSDEDVLTFYIWTIEVRADRALSVVTMTYSCYNGLIEQGVDFYYLCTKENGEWYISGMLEKADGEIYKEELEGFLNGENLWTGI